MKEEKWYDMIDNRVIEIISSEIYRKEIQTMPILNEIISRYKLSRPFSGLNVAFAHVLVPNTLPMIVALLSGGVERLSITNSKFSKYDPETVELLKKSGLEVELDSYNASEFDFAIDVGASFSMHPPKLGLSEVTRSGVLKWSSLNTLPHVVIDVDQSKCKLIETFFGNPRSVLRGIRQFIADPAEYLNQKTLSIIGFGKIGRGLARLFQKYCNIEVFDCNESIVKKASSLGFKANLVLTNDKDYNTKLIQDSDIIMTCTGVKNVVTDFFNKSGISASLLLNIGAVDEFGPDFTEEEVFMSKNYPFNFNLVPPTENMFVDAILTAHIEGLRHSIEQQHLIGIIPLPRSIDAELFSAFVKHKNFSIDDLDLYF